MRMLTILNSLYKNIVDRNELMIFKGQFAWTLNVDVLVFDELALH
jgi:exosome complex RNA-binding protein Rrp42 (RNase PH superfamily)